MSLDVKNLQVEPPLFKKGKTQCRISFKGISTTTDGNPVKLNLFIDPGEPLFLVDAAGNQLKRLTFSENMDSNISDYSLDVVLQLKYYGLETHRLKTVTKVI